MDGLHENPAFVKNSGDDWKAKTDGKVIPAKEMTKIHKIKQSEDVSMAEKDLVADLSIPNEAASSSGTGKKVAAKNKKRKPGENDKISTIKTDDKTKTSKKRASNSKINKSKDKSAAKKDVGGGPSTEDEDTKSPDTDKKVLAKNRKRKAEENDEVSTAKTEGKTETLKKMALKSKKKKSEDESVAEKEVDSGPSTEHEVTSNPSTEKKKVSDKNRKRKAEENDEVSTAKTDGKTKTMKKMALKSKINQSKDESAAKKDLVSGLAGADEVTSSPDTKKKKVSRRQLVAGPSTASEITSSKVTNKTTREKNARKAAIHPPVAEMVLESLRALKKRNGASVEQIMAHIGENYQTNVKMLKSHINRYLRKGEEGGELEKVIGANEEEKFKIKKAVNVGKGKKDLISKNRKVKLVKKSPAQKKPRKK